jgi:hypothetical protein
MYRCIGRLSLGSVAKSLLLVVGYTLHQDVLVHLCLCMCALCLSMHLAHSMASSLDEWGQTYDERRFGWNDFDVKTRRFGIWCPSFSRLRVSNGMLPSKHSLESSLASSFENSLDSGTLDQVSLDAPIGPSAHVEAPLGSGHKEISPESQPIFPDDVSEAETVAPSPARVHAFRMSLENVWGASPPRVRKLRPWSTCSSSDYEAYHPNEGGHAQKRRV